MGDHAVLTGVEHRVVLVESAGDVVGRGDRGQRRLAQSVGAHHPDVGPGDGQDGRRTVRRSRNRVPAWQFRCQWVTGQVGRQVRAHRHRADAGSASAVRNAERLVQVQVAHIAAELARPGHPDQGVEVGPVDVDLAAGVMHRGADLGDVVLEDTVGGRVGDHQRRQGVGVLGDLRAQFVEVDVTVLAAVDDDHPHADHRRRRRVGAVRTGRDQADVAVALPAGRVVVGDGEQTGVLALRTGVGLQGDRVVSGDRGQPLLQIGDQSAHSGCVPGRRERVLARELRPGDGFHLGGGVEFHGAGAQRDHGAVQREVLVGQRPQIPHHGGLGAV